MLSLFENDSATSFLEELTSDAGNMGMQTGPMAMGAMGNSSSMGQPGMDMAMVNSVQNPMAMQQQQQQQQQPGWVHPGQGHPYGADYNQFGCGKTQHMSDSNSIAGSNMGPGMMGPGRPGMMSPSQQTQQFGSPPPASGQMRSPQTGNFPANYPVTGQHSSPTIMPTRQTTPQPQQLGMGQAWNHSPGSQSNIPASPYGSSSMAQSNTPRPTYQGSSYMSTLQHDYAGNPSHPSSGPPPHQQHLSHYPDQSMNNGPYNRPADITSPSPVAGRVPGMARGPGPQSIMGPNQMSYNSGPNSMGHAGMSESQGPHPAQMGAGMQLNGTRYRFPYPSQPGGDNLMPGQQGHGDMPLSHYPQGAGQTMPPYRAQFSGNSQQQQPMLSPRPTPPPPSHTPTGHMGFTSQSQGIFSSQQGGGSLQQLEQMVPQAGSPMSAASSGTCRPNQGQSTYAETGGSQGLLGQMPHSSLSGASVVPSSMQPGGLPGARPNSQPMGPMSPNMSSGMVGNQNNMALNMEIQILQQQIQQLYNMPQNPQTQQQMLDMQERMRTLKAQQQQQLLLQQRQQHQYKQQQMLQQQGAVPPRQPASSTGSPSPLQSQQQQQQYNQLGPGPPMNCAAPTQQQHHQTGQTAPSSDNQMVSSWCFLFHVLRVFLLLVTLLAFMFPFVWVILVKKTSVHQKVPQLALHSAGVGHQPKLQTGPFTIPLCTKVFITKSSQLHAASMLGLFITSISVLCMACKADDSGSC